MKKNKLIIKHTKKPINNIQIRLIKIFQKSFFCYVLNNS